MDALVETLTKEITILAPIIQSSQFRIKGSFKRKTGGTARMEFWKNDVLIPGMTWPNATDGFLEKSGDVTNWAQGDRIQIYSWCSGATHIALIKNFRVYGIESEFNNTLVGDE